MKTRVLAGLCMVPLLAVLYFGGIPLTIVGLAIAVIGLTEFYNGWEAMGVKPSKTIAYVMTGILYAVHFFVFYIYKEEDIYILEQLITYILLLWIVIAIVVSMMYGWKIDKRGPYDAIATTIGLVYVVFFSYHIVLLDNLTYGYLFTWTVVLAAFGSDIFAYFTGFLLGKHKLAPNLSPKKTIEGAIGGVLGSTVLCGLFGAFVARDLMTICLIVGFVGGAVSQAGDLTASAFKRKMGIKDYGNLIPGHGGIMDRFDSVIFVAPFVYYLVLFLVEGTPLM